MPELPDITVYIDALTPRVVGSRLVKARARSAFLVRTFEPSLESLEGSKVVGIERVGKRIVFEFERERFLVLHLMIAGRLLWKGAGTKPTGKIEMAGLEFTRDDVATAGKGVPDSEASDPPASTPLRSGDAPVREGDDEQAKGELDRGVLIITEAGTKKRASIHIVEGREAVRSLDPGGVEPFVCTRAEFAAALQLENRTLKRVLTSPQRFSGIGNAFSDEILHAARLSPVTRSRSLDDTEIDRLYVATRSVLSEWVQRLREEFGLIEPRGGKAGAATTAKRKTSEATKTAKANAMKGAKGNAARNVDANVAAAHAPAMIDESPVVLPACTSAGRFPRSKEITAFRPDFAVHGKFGKACPVCGSTVQRIVRAENEINYCATCQNGGKMLADRSLSRLLKDDWPATIEEWEAESGSAGGSGR